MRIPCNNFALFKSNLPWTFLPKPQEFSQNLHVFLSTLQHHSKNHLIHLKPRTSGGGKSMSMSCILKRKWDTSCFAIHPSACSASLRNTCNSMHWLNCNLRSSHNFRSVFFSDTSDTSFSLISSDAKWPDDNSDCPKCVVALITSSLASSFPY